MQGIRITAPASLLSAVAKRFDGFRACTLLLEHPWGHEAAPSPSQPHPMHSSAPGCQSCLMPAHHSPATFPKPALALFTAGSFVSLQEAHPINTGRRQQQRCMLPMPGTRKHPAPAPSSRGHKTWRGEPETGELAGKIVAAKQLGQLTPDKAPCTALNTLERVWK